MAVTLSPRKNTSVVLHVSSANTGNVVVAGNSTTTNVGGTSTCLAISNEILTGVYIAQAHWGIEGNGHIQVLRGSNVVAVYSQTGSVDYAGTGMALTVGNAANLQVNFVGTSNGYCMLELQKQGTFTSEYNS